MLREVDEGRGELGLFFSEETDDKAIEAARYQFEEFVRLHLDRRASKMARRRIFMCEEKHLPMDDRQVNERLKSGNDWMWCPYCDVPHKIRLLDRKQRLPAAISSDGVAAMDRAADARRAQETDKTRLSGQEAAGTFDVFISYSHKDSELVQKELLPELRNRGLRVCIDYENFEHGVSIIGSIRSAIERCTKTLLVLTPNWLGRQWTGFELLMVQTMDPRNIQGRFVPVLLRSLRNPVRTGSFPLRRPLRVPKHANASWIDWREISDNGQARDRRSLLATQSRYVSFFELSKL